MFNQNRLIRQKKFVSGGGIEHTLMKWINGVLTKVMPKKVGGIIRHEPYGLTADQVRRQNENIFGKWNEPKKALQADAFSQPSGYDRNVVLSAINSSMGSGVSRSGPRKIVRRLY